MRYPVIMIGCGGSGSKAIRYVRDAVERQLRAAGWSQALPAAWSFIGVDLAPQEDNDEIPLLPAHDFVHLTEGHDLDTYRQVADQVIANFPPHGNMNQRELYRHMIGWRPARYSVHIPVTTGAGGFRAVGRAVGLAKLKNDLGPKLATAFTNAHGAAGLAAVSRKLTKQGAAGARAAPKAPLVVVCTSLAGGTGAGMALDVVEILRRTDSAGADPILVGFTVDIFDPITPHMAGNALGFLCELLASYWNDMSASGAGDVFQGNVNAPGHGPGSVFVVGSQSMQGNRIDGGDPHSSSEVAVYRAVGEVLSDWVTDDAVQDQVILYTNINWQAHAAATQGCYPFGDPVKQPGVVSSFGAATLSLGKERFGRWARDVLVRETVDALVSGHLSPHHFGSADSKQTEDRPPSPAPPPAQKISALAQGGISLLFDAENEDAPGLSSAYGMFRISQQGKRDKTGDIETGKLSWIGVELRGLFESTEPMKGATWKSWIEDTVTRVRVIVQEDGKDLIQKDLADWGSRIADEVCAAVSRVIAEYSVSVAAKVLELAGAEAMADAEHQVDEWDKDRGKRQNEFNDAVSQLQKGMTKFKRDSKKVETAIESGVELLIVEWDLARFRAIKEVIDSAVQHVFGQLRATLEPLVLNELRAAQKERPVADYPRLGQAPPAVYRPAPSEFLLEGPASWPRLLDELCRQIRRGDRRMNSMDAARSVLVGGDSRLGLSAVLRISDADLEWVPLDNRRFEFTCELDVESIEQRVTDLMDSATFPDEFTAGLGEYLNDSAHQDHAARMEAYQACLDSALTMASPLVQLDAGWCANLYDSAFVGSGAVTMVCSEFPFGHGHPAYAETKSRLGKAYKQAALGDDPSSVRISSFMRCPVHPVAVTSLTSVIANRVQNCKDTKSLQATFWKWRRSRTLPSFVPVPKDVRLAMISGFAVGRLCGYITSAIDKQVEITGTPVAVNADTVSFPWPLLSQINEPVELLPALLESFALCYASVGSHQQAAFEAYSRLHNLGQDLYAGSDDLLHLIATGETLLPTVDKPLVEGPTETERRASAEQHLKTQIKFFETLDRVRFNGEECCEERGQSPMRDRRPTTRYLVVHEMAHELHMCYEDVLNSLDPDSKAPEA